MNIHKRIFICLISLFSISSINGQDLQPKHWKTNFEQGINLLKIDSTQLALPYLLDAFTIAQANFKDHSKFGKSAFQLYKASLASENYKVY